MAAGCRDAAVAGLWIEVYDDHSQMVGQAVYFDWENRPLPEVGEEICLELPRNARRVHQARDALAGRVVSRQFELQRDDAGQPLVWVRLSVIRRAVNVARRQATSLGNVRFSAN